MAVAGFGTGCPETEDGPLMDCFLHPSGNYPVKMTAAKCNEAKKARDKALGWR